MHCLTMIINFQKNRPIVGTCPKSVTESFLDLVTYFARIECSLEAFTSLPPCGDENAALNFLFQENST